ncbi:2-phospho-L-lactate guanylyltransferase [Babesia caballi]|uniref:2-phospho-L-lactate guanylyltransferase n=1 Tax=Babesia caballi TaxID=5871 RepID=A0AAV4LNU0_BABCB|nr:2-phospho-L-lactate guanylyltransferase [Babesia caballi]
MTPPIDVGEGLVVKRQAAEEDLGAPFLFLIILRPLRRRRIIIVRLIFIFVSQLPYEGGLAGFEDGLGETASTRWRKLIFNAVYLSTKLNCIVDCIIGCKALEQRLKFSRHLIRRTTEILIREHLIKVLADFIG